MTNFCSSCGAQLAADAKFCAACGTTVGAAAPVSPAAPPPPAAPQYAAPPPPYYPQQQKPNIWPWVAAALALLIVVAIAVYFARQGTTDDAATSDPAVTPPTASAVTPPAAGAAESSVPVGPRVTLFVVSDANVRNQPTAQGNSAVLATLKRGTQVTGNMQIGANGKARWFKLADNSGYISSVNLNETLTAAPVVAAPASVPGAVYCTVVDRTGSSLRVRAQPNGRITGGLPHGTRLRVLGEYLDNAGVNWVNVDPDGSYPTGWVSGAHISC